MDCVEGSAGTDGPPAWHSSRWAATTSKVAAQSADSLEAKWGPSPVEVHTGREFLRKKIPGSSGELFQLEWIINHRRNHSPVHGWPETYLNRAARELTQILEEFLRSSWRIASQFLESSCRFLANFEYFLGSSGKNRSS